MLSEDSIVWTRWLRRNVGVLKHVWYDVHVGAPVRVPTDLPPEMLAVSRAVTRKRIDAVGYTGTDYWVIEVKPFGGFTALGQIVAYRRLFDAEYPPPRPPIGVLVCEMLDPDMIDDYERASIRVETAPAETF